MSSSSGMTSVSVSCSPLRSSCLVSSSVAWAAIIRRSGAAPGAGANRPAAAAVCRRGLRRHERSSLPVSSRNTSSSVRDSMRRLLGSTARSAHQAVTAASRAGWTCRLGTSIR